MTEHTFTDSRDYILSRQVGPYMGTDADSIINIPDLVKTFREGDHNSILPSQVKLIGDNACLRLDIGPIYYILLKWFEENVQRIVMARPKKMAIHC